MAMVKLLQLVFAIAIAISQEVVAQNSEISNSKCSSCPRVKLYAKLSGSYWFNELNNGSPGSGVGDGGDFVLDGPISTNNFSGADGWRYLPPATGPDTPPEWTYLQTETREIVIECKAPYPIEWVYDGDGWGPDSPSRLQGSSILRNVTISYAKYKSESGLPSSRPGPRSRLRSSSDSNTESEVIYKYKATIDGLYLYERITGQYSCRAATATATATAPGPVEDTPAPTSLLQSGIYLFVPYNSPTTPRFGKATTTVKVKAQLEEPRIPIRYFLKYDDDTVQVILPADNQVTSLRLPCSVSDPDVDVVLSKIYDVGEKLLNLHFDPKSGFTMTTSANSADTLWGEYVCKLRSLPQGQGQGQGLRILVLPPKDYEVQPSPETPLVLLQGSETAKFDCATKQPATIHVKYDGIADPSKAPLTTKITNQHDEQNPEFPNRVRLEMSQKSKYGQATGEIQCVIGQDWIANRSRMVHRWRFAFTADKVSNKLTVIPSTRHGFFDVNPKKTEITCHTDYPQLHAPMLEKIDCGSNLECFMRRYYYLKSTTTVDNGNRNRVPAGNAGKTSVLKLKYTSTIEEGILKCSLGGWWTEEVDFVLNRKTGFLRPAITQASPEEVETEPFSLEILGKDQWKFPKVDEAVFIPRNEFHAGDEATFKCHFPRKWFATTAPSIRWMLEIQDTSSGILVDDNVKACTTDVCKIKLSDEFIRSVKCTAPLRSSDTTDTVGIVASLPIVVKGPSSFETPNIQLAFVRNNQDFEQITESSSSSSSAHHTHYGHNGYRFDSDDIGDKRKDGQILYLQCRANYPVEWTYSGYFTPEIISTSQRYIPNLEVVDDLNSYYFITEILIRKFSVDYTGEYICRKVNEHQFESRVYLYFAEPKSIFLPNPEETAPVQYAKLGPSLESFRRRFQIKCPVSDPLRNITLWRQDVLTKSWHIWPNPTQIKSYDPKFGFEIHPESNPVGVYECHDDSSGQISLKTTVISKFESASDIGAVGPSFTVTPSQTKIFLSPPRIVVLSCEAHQPVTLVFSDPALKTSLVRSSNSTGNTNYRYSAFAVVETVRISSNWSTVSCIQKDGRNLLVLHTWDLTNDEPSNDPNLKTFSVTPDTSKIILFPPRVIVLLCEAHEEVTLIFSDKAAPKDSLIQSTNSTGNTKFQYSALTVVDTKTKSGFSTVTCVRKSNTNLLLHTWRLTNQDDLSPEIVTKPTFSVTPTDSKISTYPPRILVLACESHDPVKLLFSHPTTSNYVERSNSSDSTNFASSALAIIDTSKVEANLSTVSCLRKDDDGDSNTGTVLHKWRLTNEVETADEVGSTSFSVTPNEPRVPLSPPRIQVLVCESNEPVTLLFSDPAFKKSLITSRNSSGNTNYQHSAVVLIETAKITNGFSTVSCVKIGNQRLVLHKWRLTNLQPGTISRFTYDNKTNSYICCSNGYTTPQLSLMTNCHSVTECRFQACLKNPKCVLNPNHRRVQPQEYVPQTSSRSRPGCTSSSRDHAQTEGMLLCDLGVGSIPLLSYQYLLFYQDVQTKKQVHARYWNINSGIDAPLPDSLLKIESGRTARNANGRLKKFICHGPKFFFSLGFRWMLERADGSREHVPGTDKLNQNSIYKSTAYFDVEQLDDVTKIYCFAPEWNSYLWRNVSISI